MDNSKKNILDIINKLSDLQFQKEVWIDGKYFDYISNYGEAVNTLGDFNFFEEFENGIINLDNENEQKILKDFVYKILSYNEPVHNIHSILNDNEWLEIVVLAKCVLKSLKKNFNKHAQP